MLLHGTDLWLSLPIWIALWSLGITRLFAKYRAESVVIVAMLGVQMSTILIIHPTHAETPWVWFRYIAHLIPFLLLLSTLPVAWAIEVIGGRLGRPELAGWVAAGLALGFLGLHLGSHRYPVSPYAAFAPHPYMAYTPRDPADRGLLDSTSDFYRQLAEADETGALVEVPMSIGFPTYGIYQKVHGRRVYSGSVHEDDPSAIFASRGMDFRSIVDLTAEPLEMPEDARYLVFHKRIRDEVLGLHAAAKKVTPLRHHLAADRWMKIQLRLWHGLEQKPLPSGVTARYPLIHEDEHVEVYDLRPGAVRPTHLAPRRFRRGSSPFAGRSQAEAAG
jgi:hypothetical protein